MYQHIEDDFTKLLAIDMDGTCLTPKQNITERTLNALRSAASVGIMIVPTTGLTITCLPNQLKKEPYIRYAITSNGARVVDMKAGKTLFHAPMPIENVLPLLRKCSHSDLGITAHIDKEYVVQGRSLSMLGRLIYGRDARNSICVNSILSYVDGTDKCFEELQLFYFSQKARKQAEQILSDQMTFSVVYAKSYVEIFSKKATKGAALAVLAKYLEIPRMNIACIGDGENDVSMFQTSGKNFAMGNAVDSLKAKADYIVSSNKSDGVAEMIEYHLL